MLLALLVFLGGVLTILSPCILPVLPFIFARAEQPFMKSTLPLLIGMALTFAGVGTLAAVGGAWAVRVNQYGRIASLILLAAFAATLLSRHLADWLSRPFVALGNRLLQPTSQSTADGAQTSWLRSLLLGVATGLLWAPCAGPILGLVLTGAAISGPNTHTTLLLFVYAAGAATSLAVATLAGGRVFTALKKSLGTGEWIRRGLGVAVLLGVVAIAFDWDRGVLTQWSLASTDRLEQSLLEKIPSNTPVGGSMSMTNGNAMTGAMTGAANGSMTGAMTGAMNSNAMNGNSMMMTKSHSTGTPSEGDLPSFTGATSWLNSPPLTPEELRGKVVLVDFWTYSCINCLRSLPFVKTWYAKYKDHGLVVIGVHAPEFAFEKDLKNVQRAVTNLGVTYPVALDNNYAIWQAFNNQYWPAHYFIDAMGHIRGHHFGEGEYDESEQTIRQLLGEAGNKDLPAAGMNVTKLAGVEASADEEQVQSPETYVGYGRAEHFASPGGFSQDQSKSYTVPPKLELNQWGLTGNWSVGKEKAVLQNAPGKIVFRFHARDLHLVVGPSSSGKPIRFCVQIDGAIPGDDHGMDTDANGNGVVREQRLYQLIRQSKSVRDRTFSIEFLDSGVEAYSFTFG